MNLNLVSNTCTNIRLGKPLNNAQMGEFSIFNKKCDKVAYLPFRYPAIVYNAKNT